MASLLHAYFLHTRPYRETSLLIEVFTAEAGRLSAVWRGAKRGKGGVPQLFQPMMLEAAGLGELRNLRHVEVTAPALRLTGVALFSGFYLNEVLTRLLPREEAQPGLFMGYAEALGRLAEGAPAAPLLRAFEVRLLDCLGYGIDFAHDSDSGEAVVAGHSYEYFPERGFMRVYGREAGFSGAVLLKLAEGNFHDQDTAQAAKRIHRAALARLLGDKPLKSRELFLAMPDR
ncbi:MAG: repair protein RecO [Moraxellaceae bacterium]|nr:repair protein RecO [Moraxellaceae bacterium]